MVPTFTTHIDRPAEAPSSTPAASPRLRRRPSTWPPHRELQRLRSRPPTNPAWSRAAPRPISTRLEPVRLLTGLQHWFLSLHLLVSLAGPAPSGSTGTSRVVRAASRPPRRSPGRAALRLHLAAATTRREGLSPSLDNWRLVAHSSRAKKLEAARRISLARLTSRSSASSFLILAASVWSSQAAGQYRPGPV